MSLIDEKIESLDCEAALARLNSSNEGLSSSQAEIRLKRHGLNSISVQVPFDFAKPLRENFFHTMAILLWLGGFVALFAGMAEIAIAIWLVNVINGAFSLTQEYKAFRATAALKTLLPEESNVKRNGQIVRILSNCVVPGDVISLSEGDKIPADCRLLTSEKLTVDESTLTGESNSVSKSTDRENLIWAGTSVISGHTLALAFATGHNTKFGNIAHLTQTILERPSPLQLEMSRVAKIVSALACFIGLVMFVLAYALTGSPPAQAFIFAMGMVVAFVPEGMVPTVSLSLALAVKRMAKRQALVKRLSSVEALGCTNVICTDKTGTLTQNRMSVEDIWTTDDNGKNELWQVAILCNNAYKANGTFNGDATETAILKKGEELGFDQSLLTTKFPRIHEEPFESRRKMMSTIHSDDKENILLCVKGSPEIVLKHCDKWLYNGHDVDLSLDALTQINKKIVDMASSGQRLIAVAKRNLESFQNDRLLESVESNLTFLGLIAMEDPFRPEVPAAMERCHQAGVQVVMITGDHEETAKAIAKKIGIASDNITVINGNQLDAMSDQELVEVLHKNVLFARVNPEHKLKIVCAFQKAGNIVAVTGDGVNDGPALKQADIGVAMGKSGTDVAREAADMVLLDDNFASIVSAIEEGRSVYANIKKFATYVFNSNMAEAIPFAVMLFSGAKIPLPLTVMQVLSIDLGTDMVPAIALGAENSDSSSMSLPPRQREESLLSPSLLAKALLWYGLIEGMAGMSGYFYSNWLNGWPIKPLALPDTIEWIQATTCTLTCIVACQIGAVFCCRTNTRSIFKIGFFTNSMIWFGILTEIALLFALMYVPLLQKIFNTAPLGWREIIFAITWIPIIIALDEIRKWVLRLIKKDHTRKK